MKERIRKVKFRPDSLARIEQLSDIVDEFQQQGLRLTARQLYYQCVSRGLIPNVDREYKKLTALLTDARYAGMIDWDAIEDRGRPPSTPSEWDNPASLMESALRAYRLPRWKDQPRYVELWVEKQALAGVLAPLAREFHATLMVNRGYSSATAMKESADRIKAATISDQKALDKVIEEGAEEAVAFEKGSPEYNAVIENMRVKMKPLVRIPIVLYLGDHDPSGEDMVRDIEERLGEFGVVWLMVEKIALTMAQVKQYNPPPNPAKITDPRAKDYIAKYGQHSWEVDALSPTVLAQLIRSAFRRYVNKAKMDAVKVQEETDKELLRTAVASIMEKR